MTKPNDENRELNDEKRELKNEKLTPAELDAVNGGLFSNLQKKVDDTISGQQHNT
jgi:hypothetical protein